MSGLIQRIKEMKGFEVDNIEHFNNYYLNELTYLQHVPREQQHLHLDKDVRNTENMFIGGYGNVDSELGAAHTRHVPDASYVLHLFATKSDAKLLPLLGVFGLSSDMNKVCSYIKDFANDFGGNAANLSIQSEVFDGHLSFGYIKDASAYITGMITNVERKELFYVGDITLHLQKYLGHGNRCIKPEHAKSIESLRTDAVLFSRSMAGSSFRRKVQESMKDMSHYLEYSGMKYDSKNWLLLVKNV
jgi:hypothetical protein